jgi:polar amino acid transport system substrate-binding protein
MWHLAIEQARAQKIAFSPPITEIEATYVVHMDSALRSVVQVDTSGIRIAAPEKAGYELYLTRTLRNATLIRTKGLRASIDLFNERRADALALSRRCSNPWTRCRMRDCWKVGS